ncbi:MAG: S1 RNA-binding domain-containing protein [Chitinivibrionia bacterium]|nr:S1 RNA-binding domain-containing protein [Chitinivibrionia bacterium]
MQIFAKIVEDKWEIPFEAALSVCSRHERGDSIYFLSQYAPNLAVYGVDIIAEIYSFLDLQKELEPIREQARKTLKAAAQYDDDKEETIALSVSKTEIEDIVAAYKINSQSKGRAAIANGLLPLADLFFGDYKGTPTEDAKKYIDKSKGIETAQDAIDGAVAILTDRIAFNEEARYLIRNITATEGTFEVVAKKKSPKYDKFDGHHAYSSISDEELLFLKTEDESKEIKLSVSAPVLYGLEVLKHHFLQFPDSLSAHIVNRAISEAWTKFLSLMAQNSIKKELIDAATERVARKISAQVREVLSQRVKTTTRTVLIVSQNSERIIDIIVANSGGECLRVSQEDVRHYGKAFNSAKIKNIFEQWRASEFIIVENPEFSAFTCDVIDITTNSFAQKPVIKKVEANKKTSPLLKNEFVKKQIAGLEKDVQNAYISAITTIAPLPIIYDPEILQALTGNSAVKYVDEENIRKIVDRNLTLLQLEQGIEIGEKHDEALKKLGASEENIAKMRAAKNSGTLRCKNDIKNIDGIENILFNNISGFVIFPKAANILDKTLVHPLMFDLVQTLGDSLKSSVEEMIHDENRILNYESENPTQNFFIRQNLAKQLKVGAKYASYSSDHQRHFRTPWKDIVLGSITYGRVRNITDFGIFVDINAATDGLVHISEIPPQKSDSVNDAFHLGDKVRVKILDADSKRRRIALTMKLQTATIPEILKYLSENL